MTGLLSWFDEVAQADIDAMLRDPLLALIAREDANALIEQIQEETAAQHCTCWCCGGVSGFATGRGDEDVPCPVCSKTWEVVF